MEHIIGLLRDALEELADPDKAGPMQAYMKSEIPYLGIPAAPRRKACNQIFKEYPIWDEHAWRALALEIWRGATYREERYAALDLLGFSRYRKFNSPACLPMYEEMIVSGAWWDYVDDIAVHRIGGLFGEFREALIPEMRTWSVDDNMWKRRTSIICQIQRRDETDEELLRTCIVPSMDSKEFFLRKAIGWALRAYANTNAQYVMAFVDEYQHRLSRLSKKEALRKILKS